MPKKDPAAVALGRKGGKARLKTMTAQERSKRARTAARTRWDNVRRSDGQPLPADVAERLNTLLADRQSLWSIDVPGIEEPKDDPMNRE
jgi:hypothetical protein